MTSMIGNNPTHMQVRIDAQRSYVNGNDTYTVAVHRLGGPKADPPAWFYGTWLNGYGHKEGLHGPVSDENVTDLDACDAIAKAYGHYTTDQR